MGAPRPTLTPARGLAALVLASAIAALLWAMALVVPPQMPLNARVHAKTMRPGPAATAPAGLSAPGSQMRKRQR